MSNKTLSISLLTTLIVSFSSATFAANPATDISGIQLGSSFASVRPLLTKINPNYQFYKPTRHYQIKEGMKTIIASIEEKNGTVDSFFIVANNKDLVFSINRSQTLGQGERIKKETLIQAIKEKYGKPTKEDGREMIWEFDQNGSLNSEEHCRYKNSMTVPGIPDLSDFELEETCSRRYESYMFEDQDSEAPGMISKFGVWLVDINLMLEERRQAESEKQKAIEQEAKTNKPEL